MNSYEERIRWTSPAFDTHAKISSPSSTTRTCAAMSCAVKVVIIGPRATSRRKRSLKTSGSFVRSRRPTRTCWCCNAMPIRTRLITSGYWRTRGKTPAPHVNQRKGWKNNVRSPGRNHARVITAAKVRRNNVPIGRQRHRTRMPPTYRADFRGPALAHSRLIRYAVPGR